MAKRDMIENELRRCMTELSTLKRTSDPELARLEAEMFGCSLGALHNPGVDKYHSMGVYHVQGDGPIDLEALPQVHSCLSGDLYGTGKPTDSSIIRTEVTRSFDRKIYQLIVHWTRNKEDEKRICSISIIEKGTNRKGEPEEHFLAYLFTTNDPLAFDNFNCFRGGQGPTDAPQIPCVEQRVFCMNKVKVAQHFLKEHNAQTLHKFMMKNFVNKDLFLKMGWTQEKWPDNWKDIHLAAWADDRKEQFYYAYTLYLNGQLHLSTNLLPKDNYKEVGQAVILDSAHLRAWDEMALMCAVNARMKALRDSKHERGLAAALMPKCILECSQHDDKWAYKIPQVDKKEDPMLWLLTDAGFAAMITNVKHQVKYQDEFIQFVGQQVIEGEYLVAMKRLFAPGNMMLLGLSERIIQSVWRGELEIDTKLEKRIADRLKAYGIEFELYNATLVKSEYTSLDVLRAIGMTEQEHSEAAAIKSAAKRHRGDPPGDTPMDIR